LSPFTNYTAYSTFIEGNEQSVRDEWRWKRFFDYNDILVKMLEDRKSSLKHLHINSTSLEIEALDVLPMTILRRDGHMGDEFRPRAIPEGDCLHYALPGPVDWWNHLLFNNLKDIVIEDTL
jgi:hypothetical protein